MCENKKEYSTDGKRNPSETSCDIKERLADINKSNSNTDDANVSHKKNISRIKAVFKTFFGKRASNKELYSIDDSIDQYADPDVKSDTGLSNSFFMIKVIALFFLIMLIWAYFGNIDEVTKGGGVVIPGLKEQVIQSSDGGILESLNVREGDVIQKNQIVARLDATRARSLLDETYIKYYTAMASILRLESLLNESGTCDLRFPDELNKFPQLIKSQTAWCRAEKNKLKLSLENLDNNIAIIRQQVKLNRDLLSEGANSKMDVLKLEGQLSELESRRTDMLTEFRTRFTQELTKTMAEMGALKEQLPGKRDIVNKAVIRSPVRGIVKDIQSTTIGGAIPPNGSLMRIVPLGDVLMIEAKLSPRDIAFIHPGQKAKVKITAYDYAIYGGLDGEVYLISPDTLKEENASPQKNTYYRVYIRTMHDYITNKSGRKFYISPGMIAQVEIKTGSKTVLQYLIKPFNKINEALRER